MAVVRWPLKGGPNREKKRVCMGRICATRCGKRNGALGRAGRTTPGISALRSPCIQAKQCQFRLGSCSLHVRSRRAKAPRVWAAGGAFAPTAGCRNLSAAARIWSRPSPKSSLTPRSSHGNSENPSGAQIPKGTGPHLLTGAIWPMWQCGGLVQSARRLCILRRPPQRHLRHVQGGLGAGGT